MNNQKGIAPIIIILVLVAIIGGGTLVWQNFSAQKEEVKVPENIVKDETTDWQTYRNEEYGFEMKYPEDFLPTQSLQPKTKIIQCDYVNFINECPFAPIEGFIGTEESAFRQGLAARPTPERITVNDVSFCRQENHEGAMGTSYITYNYTTVREKKCFVVSFAVPYPNCSNHLPIESQEIQEIYDKCEYKNKVTKPETIDKMLSTFSFFEIKSSLFLA